MFTPKEMRGISLRRCNQSQGSRQKTGHGLLPLLCFMTNGSRKYHLWGNSSGFFYLNVPFYLLFHLFHTLTSFSPLYYPSGIHSYSALLGCCCNLALQTSYPAALYQSDHGFSLEGINASLSLLPQYCEVGHYFPVDTVLHDYLRSPKKILHASSHPSALANASAPDQLLWAPLARLSVCPWHTAHGDDVSIPSPHLPAAGGAPSTGV